jgi:hypothetical protein
MLDPSAPGPGEDSSRGVFRVGLLWRDELPWLRNSREHLDHSIGPLTGFEILRLTPGGST